MSGTPRTTGASEASGNVFVLSVDSLNYRYFLDHFTPVLNRLDAVTFTNAVATASNTNSSVPALSAGVYADFTDAVGLPPSGTPTPLAECLSTSGYQCGLWTDNFLFGESYNYDRGFTGGNVGAISWKRKIADYLESQPVDFLYDAGEWVYFNAFSPVLSTVSSDTGSFWKSAGTLNDSMIEWLIETADDPVLAWVHYMDTHHPYEPPMEYFNESSFTRDWDKGELAQVTRTVVTADGEGYDEQVLEDVRTMYRSCCHYLADELADLIDRLLDRRLFDPNRDLLVLTADHGEALHPERHGQLGHQSCWEDVVHVPLIVNHPDWDAGTVDSQISLIDLMPTLCDFADVAPPESVAGTIRGSPADCGVDEALFVNAQPWYRTRRGIRTEDGWKLFGHKSRDNEYEIVMTQYEPADVSAESIVHRTPISNPKPPDDPRHASRWETLTERLIDRLGPPVAADGQFEITEGVADHLEQLGYLE